MFSNSKYRSRGCFKSNINGDRISHKITLDNDESVLILLARDLGCENRCGVHTLKVSTYHFPLTSTPSQNKMICYMYRRKEIITLSRSKVLGMSCTGYLREKMYKKRIMQL